MILKIGDTDFSACLIKGSYNVNEVKETHDWTDSNYKKHSDVLRRRIVGSFAVRPMTEDLYAEFVQALDANTNSDNVTTISLYVTNIKQVRTIQAHVSTEATVKIANGDRIWLNRITYKIEEE